MKPGAVTEDEIDAAANFIVQEIKNGRTVERLQTNFRTFMRRTFEKDLNTNLDYVSLRIWEKVAALLAEKVQAKKQD